MSAKAPQPKPEDAIKPPPPPPPPPLMISDLSRSQSAAIIAAIDQLEAALAPFELRLRKGHAAEHEYKWGAYYARQLGAHTAMLNQLAEDQSAIDRRHDVEVVGNLRTAAAREPIYMDNTKDTQAWEAWNEKRLAREATQSSLQPEDLSIPLSEAFPDPPKAPPES